MKPHPTKKETKVYLRDIVVARPGRPVYPRHFGGAESSECFTQVSLLCMRPSIVINIDVIHANHEIELYPLN